MNLTFIISNILQTLCEIWKFKIQVHCNKESQSYKYQLKCHNKRFCFDQILHICLLKKKKNLLLKVLFAAPQWLEGERWKNGVFRRQLSLCGADQLFTLGRQIVSKPCLEMSIYIPNGYVKSVG